MKTTKVKPRGVPPFLTQSDFGLQLMGLPSDVRSFSLAIGWDDNRFWKPFVACTVFKVAVILGWHKREEDALVRYDKQAVTVTMRRDYWAEVGYPARLQRIAVCKTHDPEADEPRPFTLDGLLEEAGIQDGDEYEVLVTATGRRPHGDRLYMKVGALMRPETDEECMERIANEA